jgi:hypothetical protein
MTGRADISLRSEAARGRETLASACLVHAKYGVEATTAYAGVDYAVCGPRAGDSSGREGPRAWGRVRVQGEVQTSILWLGVHDDGDAGVTGENVVAPVASSACAGRRFPSSGSRAGITLSSCGPKTSRAMMSRTASRMAWMVTFG